MKFTVNKSSLEFILSSLQPFLEKKDNSQITTNILFEATPEALILKATDQEFGLMAKITEYKTETFGKFTCNGKKILDIIRILKDSDITIEYDDSHILIKQNRSKYKLPTLDAYEFPNFPSNENISKITLDSQKLLSALKKTLPAVATNNPKFELNGALLDIRGSIINIVATDTRRLAIYKIEQDTDKNMQIILPKKAITEILKLFSTNIKLYFDNSNVMIEDENFFFFSKVINGKYPDYERIIPKELKNRFSIETEKMIDAIRQVAILSADIVIVLENGQIGFEILDSHNEEARTGFESDIEFENSARIALNSRYILDFLTQCQSEKFDLGFNEVNLPFEVKSGEFSTIIMPISI